MKTKQDMFHYFSRKYRLNLNEALLRMFFFAILFSIVSITPVGDFFDTHFARKIDFTLRTLLKKDPKLDPRIKVYSLEDFTVNKIQSPDLTAPQWVELLKDFAEERPKVILIDKIFSLYNEKELPSQEFVNRLQEISTKVPIYVGAFASEQNLSGREKLSYQKPEYSLKICLLR